MNILNINCEIMFTHLSLYKNHYYYYLFNKKNNLRRLHLNFIVITKDKKNKI